jgi:hypothetical protein
LVFGGYGVERRLGMLTKVIVTAIILVVAWMVFAPMGERNENA